MTDIEALAVAIRKAHGCDATHTASVPLVETFRGATVWAGVVEVFTIRHPEASTCYAWSYDGDRERQYVTVLGKPPITTPQRAVQAHIAGAARRAKQTP